MAFHHQQGTEVYPGRAAVKTVIAQPVLRLSAPRTIVAPALLDVMPSWIFMKAEWYRGLEASSHASPLRFRPWLCHQLAVWLAHILSLHLSFFSSVNGEMAPGPNSQCVEGSQ